MVQEEKYSLIVVDDEVFIGRLLVDVMPLLLEGSRAVNIVAGSPEVPDLHAVMTHISAAVANALDEDFVPVILLDQNMGITHAGAVLNALTLDVPVILSSGYSSDQLGAEYKRFEASGKLNAFLDKPFKTDDLVAAIRKALKLEAPPASPEEAVDPIRYFDTLEEAVGALETFVLSLERFTTLDDSMRSEARGLLNGLEQSLDDYLLLQTGVDKFEIRARVHNVRNYLTIPKSLLSVRGDSQPTGEETLVKIRPQLERALTALKGKEREPAGQPKELRELLDELREMGGKEVTYSGQMPNLAPEVDRYSLEVILLNLFNNANLHPDISTLHFEVQETEDEVLILVSDDGPALPTDFFDVDLEREEGLIGNGARHMLRTAKENGWTLEDGRSANAKFVLKISKNK